MDKLAFVVLWIFAFMVPWEDAVFLPGLGTIGRITGALAFALGVLVVVMRGNRRRLNSVHVFMILFVLWAALSILWTVDADATVRRVTTYSQLALLAWLISELGWSRGRQLTLLQAYVLGAYVPVLGTLMNYSLGAAAGGSGARFAGFGYNPNELGFIVALGFPIAWFLALSMDRGTIQWINRLYIPIGMTAILLTASRGAFVPALAGLLIIPWTLHRLRLRQKVVIAGLGIASVSLIAAVVPQTSWNRLASTRAEVETGTFGGRMVIWKAGIEAFAQRPLIGFGAGAFGAAVRPILGRGRSPHQTVLSVVVGQGLVGLALLAGMFVAPIPAVSRMSALDRRFWIVLLLTLGIGLLPRTWDYRKPTWFLLGLLAAQVAVAARPSSFRHAPDVGADRLSRTGFLGEP